MVQAVLQGFANVCTKITREIRACGFSSLWSPGNQRGRLQSLPASVSRSPSAASHHSVIVFRDLGTFRRQSLAGGSESLQGSPWGLELLTPSKPLWPFCLNSFINCILEVSNSFTLASSNPPPCFPQQNGQRSSHHQSEHFIPSGHFSSTWSQWLVKAGMYNSFSFS